MKTPLTRSIEYDVNLFDEEDLYDINIIGSMLKAWLRELPDELLPKAAQERISRECAGAEEVPQMLIDELSDLPPFNYYLLFAITCHLSLLLAHSDKNKMDFRNLCICFQPCMKIDAFCFRFLVCEWRNCWKGCKNEGKYIVEEYKLFDQPPPRGLSGPQEPVTSEAGAGGVIDDKATGTLTAPPTTVTTSSAASTSTTEAGRESKSDMDKGALLAPTPLPTESQSSTENRTQPSSTHTLESKDTKSKPKMKPLQLSESNHSVGSITSSISIAANSDRERKGSADMRPLSPIQPLSPLGF